MNVRNFRRIFTTSKEIEESGRRLGLTSRVERATRARPIACVGYGLWDLPGITPVAVSEDYRNEKPAKQYTIGMLIP